jgi:hypothetical protein
VSSSDVTCAWRASSRCSLARGRPPRSCCAGLRASAAAKPNAWLPVRGPAWLDVRGTTVAIEIYSVDGEREAFLEAVEPILDSMTFPQ